jgi:hypothetical protein
VGVHVLFLRIIGCAVKMTTHFHLVPRLRMCGAVPLLLLYVFMVWKGTTLSQNEDNALQVVVVVMLYMLIQVICG